MVKVAVKFHIREYRQKAGLSLPRLSDRCGISATHLSDVENGKTGLSVQRLCMIAVALEVEPGELFSYEAVGDGDEGRGRD